MSLPKDPDDENCDLMISCGACGFTGSPDGCDGSKSEILVDLSEGKWEPEDMERVFNVGIAGNIHPDIAPWKKSPIDSKPTSNSSRSSRVNPEKRSHRPKSSSQCLKQRSSSEQGSVSSSSFGRQTSGKSRGYSEHTPVGNSKADFEFQHCDDDTTCYIKHYRRYYTAGHVGEGRHLVLGFDVPDPYMGKLKFYRHELLTACMTTTVPQVNNTVPAPVSKQPPPVYRHDNSTTTSTSPVPQPRPYSRGPDVNLSPIPQHLSRDRSVSVSNMDFPPQRICKKTFSPTSSQSYLNLALPRSLLCPTPLQVLLDNCPQHLPVPQYRDLREGYRCSLAPCERQRRPKAEGVRGLGRVAAAAAPTPHGCAGWSQPAGRTKPSVATQDTRKQSSQQGTAILNCRQ